jgi:hypothetical protein
MGSGCCGSLKHEMEDYFLYSLNMTNIRKLSVKDAYELIIENTGLKIPENDTGNFVEKGNSITLKDNRNSITNVLENFSKIITKNQYQTMIQTHFMMDENNDTKEDLKVFSRNKDDYPRVTVFNKLFFDILYNEKKQMLMVNLFPLFNHSQKIGLSHKNNSKLDKKENDNNISIESTEYFYKLLEGIFGKNKVKYSSIKRVLSEYLKICLCNPYEVSYKKSDEEKKSDIREILENEFSESQRCNYLDNILKDFEILRLKSNFEDEITKDSSFVCLDDFKFIFNNNSYWSWDIFELRSIYIIKLNTSMSNA